VLGFHLALLTALLTGVVAGVPALDVAVLSTIAGASFFAWGMLRRLLAGREALVAFEHIWVAFGAVALVRWAAGSPVLPGLDVLAVGLCPFLAAGRIGCLTAGCCHGRPAAVGVVYPPSDRLPDRLVGVRLFPAPLVEAAALVGIGVAGLAMAAGSAGAAAVWVLSAYATVRFGTEALRGDPRPALCGVSVPRLMCAVQFAAALALGELATPGQDARRLMWAVAVLLPACLAGIALARRRRDPLTAPAHLDEVWGRIRAMAATAPNAGHEPSTCETSAGLRLAASWGEYGLHASFSHPTRSVTAVPYALGLTPLAWTGTATHVVVSPPRIPDRARQPYPYTLSTGLPQSGVSGASSGETGGDYFGERPDV
jgi:hypothetical protein